nr:14592_t:CDS:10 [Entrophospora candida]
MVLLVLTERIRTAIYQAIQSPEFDESARQRLRSYLKASACIPLDLIKEVSNFLVSRDGKLGREIGLSSYWLHELLTGSGIYVQPRKEKVKSPELVAKLEKILAEQANKEYARMVGKVASSYDVETFKLLDTEEFQSIRGQLTAIINITFTVVAVFAAVYHVAQTITGDTGMRVLLALSGSVIVGIAETFLYMRYLTGYDSPTNNNKNSRKEKDRSKIPSSTTLGVGVIEVGAGLAVLRKGLMYGLTITQMFVSLEIPSRDKSNQRFLQWMSQQSKQRIHQYAETQELALAKLLFLLVGAEWSPFGLSRNVDYWEYHICVGICCMGHQEVAKVVLQALAGELEYTKILMQLLTQAIADSYNRTAAISWKKPSSTNERLCNIVEVL